MPVDVNDKISNSIVRPYDWGTEYIQTDRVILLNNWINYAEGLRGPSSDIASKLNSPTWRWLSSCRSISHRTKEDVGGIRSSSHKHLWIVCPKILLSDIWRQTIRLKFECSKTRTKKMLPTYWELSGPGAVALTRFVFLTDGHHIAAIKSNHQITDININ